MFEDQDYKDYILYKSKYLKGKKFVPVLTVTRRLKTLELKEFLDEHCEEVTLKLDSGRRLPVLAFNYHKLYEIEVTAPYNIFRLLKKRVVFKHKVNRSPYLTYDQASSVLAYLEYVLRTYPELTLDQIKKITKNINRKINDR